MRRLDRYVIAEILGPLAIGFLAYTFILIMQFLFRSAEMIIRRGVPAEQVGQLLLVTLPNIVVLTIPMSLLFAILVAVGRLAASNELTAMRASGLSLFSLYRPILLIAFVLTLLNTGLMLYVLPWGNTNLQALQLEILTKSVSRQVEPRVFYEEWEGLVVYVFEIPPGSPRWKGVFVAESLPSAENQVTVAEWGEVRLEDREGEKQLVLHLENAVTHKVDFAAPDEYHISSHRRLQRVLEEPEERDPTRKVYKSLRELNLQELRAVLAEPEPSPMRFNLARVEIHKKFSIPMACMVFALIGLPLGFGKQKAGRAGGFAMSIVVILIYYVLLNNGEKAARAGKIEPWLSMWLPNIAFFGAALLLMMRKNRDKSLFLSQIEHWFRELKVKWKARRERRTRARRPVPGGRRREGRKTDVVLRLPRPRLRFPGTMDRYIAKLFLFVFAMVLVSAVSLFVVADFTEKIDEIMRFKASTSLVLDYYKYSVLQIGYELAPISVLLATLITFGLLSRTNEVIAAKALGMSLYRLSVPVLVSAAGIVGLCWLMQARVLPITNQEVAHLEDKIRGRSTPRSYRRADRNWLFGQGRYIYNYLHYDSSRERLQRLQVFEFGDDHQLNRRLYASNATYLGDGWRFDDSWFRSFNRLPDGRIAIEYTPQRAPVIDRYPETPNYFESEFKQPNAMSYRQLERYVAEIHESGQAAPELEVELHNKIGYPVICLVMALVALPFSFRLGRRGALYGIGVGLALGMVFLGLFAFSRTLGEAGALPPLVAIWSPGVAFTIFSVYMFLGVET